jgi:plastocyanin
MRNRAWLALMAALLCLPGCSKKEAESKATAPKEITVVDPATAAAVSGVVKLEGTPPAAVKIDMSQDPACGTQPNFSEMEIAKNGDLANVFVYIKDGLGDRGFAIPRQPVEIHQHGCRYVPHVAGAMAGQTVEFINDDETTHNIHPMPKDSRQWNEAQMPKAEPIKKTFDRPEIMIPIKCNQHPWMRMYLNVVDHPFYAVTGPDGRFDIKGLPPGTYTIAAVQEQLGDQDMKVTVGPRESKDVDFTFKQQPEGNPISGR